MMMMMMMMMVVVVVMMMMMMVMVMVTTHHDDHDNIVDARNPAPVDMVKNIFWLYTYQLLQDFSHQ